MRPPFGDYLGGHQISLIPPNATSTKPQFAGQTTLTPYGRAVLSPEVATIFEGDFTSGPEQGVPVRRYDLSGYGASLTVGTVSLEATPSEAGKGMGGTGTGWSAIICSQEMADTVNSEVYRPSLVR